MNPVFCPKGNVVSVKNVDTDTISCLEYLPSCHPRPDLWPGSNGAKTPIANEDCRLDGVSLCATSDVLAEGLVNSARLDAN